MSLEDYLIEDGETGFDRVLAFTVPQSDARGRIVRLGPVLETVLSAHDYPAPIHHLLSEALVLTALMGAQMKDEAAQFTMQAQAEGGPVELLVCDYRRGELRGYVRHVDERLSEVGANPTLPTLFGKGYLAITFDLAASDQRYQGVVPLEGQSLAEACETYFALSEQIPTLIRTAVHSQGPRTIAGGMMVQHFPDREEGGERLHVREDAPQWQHVTALAGSIRHDELIDPGLSLEQLVWRLFHEEPEIRVDRREALERGCRCSVAHYEAILSRFSEADRAEMRGDDGLIAVDCAFCSKVLRIAL